MAATAYAAVVSLLNTMDQIKIHPLLSTYFNKYPIESLREKVGFFVDFVENYSDAESEAEDLVRQIADVAHDAEEVINAEAAYRIRTTSTTKSLIMPRKVKKIIEEMDCIKEKVIRAKQETGFINPYSLLPPASSSAPPQTAKTTENCSYAEDLVRRMAVVALKAEDIFKFQAAAQIRSGSTEKSRTMSRKLQRKKKVMDSNKEKVIKAKEKTGFINSMPPPSSSSAPPAIAKTTTNTMVGFDCYVEQLLDQLTRHHSGRKILPIVGMGGIGKTTLATNVYQNSLMVHHFDLRAWITVSQEFSARKMILQALSCLVGSTSNTDISDDQLGEELYKILSGRRYLIVLDDIWSVEAWEKMKFFFPENNNRSRIVVTTRESELVDYFGSSALAVDFLDDKNSWELFCEKTFAKEGCPPELEQIGKEIVKKCKGLPLSITVIGGLLRKSSRTREYWEIIAKDKSLILDSGEGNKPLSILNLSYKHLPVWLKSCFLYLGLYPEDHEIDVSQLIKLWVAEGFIRSKTEQSLEEVAESYTKELVDRNLLLVGDVRPNKKLDSCRVHDLVRELCIRIGEKENYFCVQRDIDGKRHFIVDEPTARFYPRDSHTTSETPSIVCPLILEGQRAAPFKSRLLRVLFSVDGGRLDSTFQLVNLRFLFNDGYDTSMVLSSIPLLWSLQTLIVDYVISFDAPCEIWKMPQLRHIDIQSISLPDPPTCSGKEDDVIVLQNLQTLKTVHNLILSEKVCRRLPNITELGIIYELDEPGGKSSCYHLHNVSCLHKLESLFIFCSDWKSVAYSFQNLKLPSSIKELSLSSCKLVWSDMAMIASLPHLQILDLGKNAVVGPEWNLFEEKFLCLRHLQIDDCDDLIKWNADSSNFPVLETLSLESLSKLEEIPSGIGDIPTLERIEMDGCSESSTISAVKILEEQESFGNQGLQLHLSFRNGTRTWKKIQQLGSTCQNLFIKRC